MLLFLKKEEMIPSKTGEVKAIRVVGGRHVLPLHDWGHFCVLSVLGCFHLSS